VRVYVLGPFAVHVGTSPITFAGKAQKKPLELLKLLTAHGRAGIDGDAAACMLWPDGAGDAAQSALRTNVHRLRRLLGHEHSVLVRDGHVQLNAALCWVDAWALEAICTNIARADERKLAADAKAALGEHLLRLYRGPAFGTESLQPWMLLARDRWRGKYLAAIARIGQFEQSRGKLEQAIELFRRGIEAEPLHEDSYRCLMQAYLQAGRPVEAYGVYRRCRDVLSITLGLRPSPAMEVLRRQAAEGDSMADVSTIGRSR
jgi:pentatricopeptide repeat protein